MEMRSLGRDGPQISVVGYGAWEAGGDVWGRGVSDDRVIEAIRSALDDGCNWIDTAEAYGDGRSEELVARAIEGRRDDVLIFTKVAPFVSGVRPEQVKRGIEGSLARLRTDHVDLYQIHWPDRKVPIEETWGAMAELVDEGLTRHIGVSNFGRPLIERCLAIRQVDSVQNQFSLLAQRDRAELLPWLEESGIGYLAYGPLAFGLLTGTMTRDTTFEKDDWRRGDQGVSYYEQLFAPGTFEENVDKVERLKPLAERLGTDVATLSLRAALEIPGITGVIAGSRNPDHVRENAAAGDLELDDVTLKEIDQLL